jgi:ABC-type sugar transport system substrate-binding protein
MPRIYTALILIGLILLAGCNPTPTAVSVPSLISNTTTPISIGYSAPETSGGQTEIMRSFVERAAARRWKVITTNANSDSKVQASQIDYLLSKGVKAVVVVPVDSQAICASVQKSRSAGVLFYTIDRAPIGCQIDMSVLSDNYLGGVQAGQAMVKFLTERYHEPKGTVLEYQGNLQQNVAQLRGNGFHSVVDQYPGIKVISQPTDWKPERFSQITSEYIPKNKFDGLYLHSDGIGIPVIIPILGQLGQKIPRGQAGHIFITGVDGSPDMLQAIRDGYADQSSSQPLTDFGIIVDWIDKELNGEKISEGQVIKQGLPWSPATIKLSDTGYQLLLSTTSVTIDNVNNAALWGNH